MTQSSFGIALFSFGGLVANICLIVLSNIFRVPTLLTALTVLSAAFISCFAIGSSAVWSAWFGAAGCGASLIACTVGQSALAVITYPPEMRATGIGLSAAFGRLGSIAGPAAMGALLSLGWKQETIVFVSITPIALAALAVIVFGANDRGSSLVGRTRAAASSTPKEA